MVVKDEELEDRDSYSEIIYAEQCWEKKIVSGRKKHSFTGQKSCLAKKPRRDISYFIFSDSV